MFQISLRQTVSVARLLHSSKFNSYRFLKISQGNVSIAARTYQSTHHFARQSNITKAAASTNRENVVSVSTADTKDMVNLKIKLFSSSVPLLDYYEKYLTFYCQSMNPKSYKLPTRSKTFVLLKSPHVYKKAKEHYFFEGNSRVIEVGLSKTGAHYVMNLLKNVHNLDVKFRYVEK